MVKSRFGGVATGDLEPVEASLVRRELHLDIQPRARHAGSQLWRRRGEAEASPRLPRAHGARGLPQRASCWAAPSAAADEAAVAMTRAPPIRRLLLQTHVSCLLLWMVLSSHKDTAWAPIFPVAANISISVAGRRSPRAARARVRGSGGMSRAERSPRECERSASVPELVSRALRLTRRATPTGARGRALRVTVRSAMPMRRREHDEAGPARARGARGARRTGRSRRSAVPRSRRASRPLRSLPSGSPSNSARSRSHAAPLPRSRHRPPCERASSAQRRASRGRRRGAWSLVGAAAAAVLAVAVGLVRASLGHAQASDFHAALAPTGLVPGAGGEATLTKTASGWRIELDATGLPRRAGRSLLRGLAAQRRRRARADRDVQRRPQGHALGGRFAEGLPTLTVTREQADGDQASSGEKVLVGTGRRDAADSCRQAVDAAHDLLAGAVEAAHHRAFGDPQRSGRLLVREAGDVDGDEHVAEVAGSAAIAA